MTLHASTGNVLQAVDSWLKLAGAQLIAISHNPQTGMNISKNAQSGGLLRLAVGHTEGTGWQPLAKAIDKAAPWVFAEKRHDASDFFWKIIGIGI